MGEIAGIGGLIGGLAGLFGGGDKQPQGPPPFIMPGMGQAASGALGGISGLQPFTGAASGTLGPSQNTFQNLYNNPYAGLFQGGANTAAGLGQNAALGAYGAGGLLQNAGLGTIPISSQIFNTAFDPQSATYARTLQQIQEQARAGEAARGIATTPYGAGLENDVLRNFNIDWQNNLLQRQALGAQAGGGLLSQGAGVANLGTGIQNLAPGQFFQASGMPYGAFGQIGGGQNAAIQALLGNIGGGANIANLPVSDYVSYLGAGNQANQVANQNYANQLAAQKQQFGQQMQLGGMIGNSLYGLGQSPFGQQFGTGIFAPGGSFSPFGSYINPSGDLIGGGQILPG